MKRMTGKLAVAIAALAAGSAMAQDMSKIVNTPHNMANLDVWGVVIPENQVDRKSVV